jgi:signal transduction histidine kinase/Tfp pilus assembly protein PilF
MPVKCLLFVCLLSPAALCLAQSPEIENIQHSLHAIRDSSVYVNALNRLAMLLYEKNIDSTFYYTKKAREISDRLQYAQGTADALNNLGVIYDIKGDVQLALRYYDEANNSYEALHDSSNIVQTLMNIASVYQESGKDEKAIAEYRKALTLGRDLTRDSILSLVSYNYLMEPVASLTPDSAALYFRKARDIASKYKDDRVLLALDQITADNALKNGHRDQGIALLKQAIDQAVQNHLYFLSLDLFIDLGDRLAPTDSALAVDDYKQALALTYQKGYLLYSQVLARKLYDFYVDHHDNASAFNYSRQLLKLTDEQGQVANASGVDYIDYALKDQELQAIRLRSRYQDEFLVLAAVICIMTVVITIILWRNWKKSQRTANALRLQFEQSEATTGALDTMNKNYAQLLKIVAHDLRSPIGAVATVSSILAKKVSDPETAKLIQLLQTSSQTSINLINELLEADFDQQPQLVKEIVMLDQLLRQSVYLLNFRAKDKNQEIVLESDEGIEVEIDKEKMGRVISNLIVNAIKFSPEYSKVFVSAKIVTTNRRPTGVVIIVKDAGIGIPAEMQDRIFDPFTTARRKGTGGEQPFGLGLYISKQIVEAHHGRIRFISQPDMGTEFFVELPLPSTAV